MKEFPTGTFDVASSIGGAIGTSALGIDGDGSREESGTTGPITGGGGGGGEVTLGVGVTNTVARGAILLGLGVVVTGVGEVTTGEEDCLAGVCCCCTGIMVPRGTTTEVDCWICGGGAVAIFPRWRVTPPENGSFTPFPVAGPGFVVAVVALADDDGVGGIAAVALSLNSFSSAA